MIRVLVVDDSLLVRSALTRELAEQGDIVVVGTAADAYEAREKILSLDPDVVTLDVEMPKMDGISFLARLMKYHPLPVVIFSSVTEPSSKAALQALLLGAVEVVAKTPTGNVGTVASPELLRGIRAAARANIRPHEGSPVPPVIRPPNLALRARIEERLIAIGASTGGPAALERILMAMPADSPPMLIVQHMPGGFIDAFTRRLDGCTEMKVRMAQDGSPVESGVALVAPGDRHMVLLRNQAELRVALRDGPAVHHARPSVDVLFHSIASAGAGAVGILLTGMGRDGANGMRALHDAGAHTIAQAPETCVVSSMPEEAIRLGAVSATLSLTQIPAAALNAATSIVLGRKVTADRPLS